MSSTTKDTLVHQLSPVDHLSPRIHVPKLLYFSTTSKPEQVISTLQVALGKSISALPILGGSVGLMKGAPQKGTLAVQAPFFTSEEILSVKDLRDQYDYDTILEKSFRPDAVDGELVAPDLAANPSRVFLAQANLIKGGLVLVIAIHHCVVDETGIFDVVNLWSTNCSGGDGVDIVTPEWTDRSSVMKGEGSSRLEDHGEYKLLPEEKSATIATKPTEYISKASDKSSSAIFFFSDESLGRMKKDASSTANVSGSGESNWISTNDALCALMWSSVTKARNSVGMGDATYSMFNMTVNGRSRISPPVSPEYMGNTVFVSKAFAGIDALASSTSNLAEIASTVRNSVFAVDNKAIKDKIKAVTSVDDIGRLAPGGYNPFQRHLGCTSWSGQQYYQLDWGETLGGKCRRVRWRKTISDGVFVIFPRVPPGGESDLGGGGLEVYLGLQREHLGVLRKDEVFNKYAEWRCV